MVSPAARSLTEPGTGDSPAPQSGGRDGLHVAIIMDGNGRWAKARGLPRTVGHERGVEALRAVVEAAGGLGVSHLTVFSFSTENWRRPAAEVSTLFMLLRAYIRQDLKRLKREGVRIRVIGTNDNVPDDIRALIDEAEATTADNNRFHLTVAFNYGGREEILRAARSLANEVATGARAPNSIDDAAMDAALDTVELPDPDLMIRTSGEKRISNFLLWQCAFSELYFTDTLWPDFSEADLKAALEDYAQRERRYGAVTPGGA
ncbi:MAG: isoprenyl transferase [Pseudomonadota bacterium]